ncbi:MAG: MaoC family dehydratase [Actinomycetota bacterium]|nr:MaoC family dehydratase [Actinomycetota bacterium]
MPEPADLLHFEDFLPGQVIELGTFPPVSEDDIISFARQWDPQPFHTDPERAKQSMWGGIIASGWHTGAIAMRLLVDGLLSRCASQGSPGVDHVRFRLPVRPGDVLSGRHTIIETSPSASRPRMGKIRAVTELVNQRGETVVSMDAVGFYDRRDSTPESH